MYYVVVILLEDMTVDALVGPFESGEAAMNWADSDATIRQQEHPELSRESTDEMMVLADMREEHVDEPVGYVYQAIKPIAPVLATNPQIEEI